MLEKKLYPPRHKVDGEAKRGASVLLSIHAISTISPLGSLGIALFLEGSQLISHKPAHIRYE